MKTLLTQSSICGLYPPWSGRDGPWTLSTRRSGWRGGCRLAGGTPSAAGARLLNVSYDPTRELYEEINALFVEQWGARRRRPI